MATMRPTIRDRARRSTALALLWLLGSACIDERVSLGHHQVPLPPDVSGGMMSVPMTGGQAAPALDASIDEPPIDASMIEPPDAAPPGPASPCEGSVYVATLRCAVENFGMPPSNPDDSMITQSVLTIEPVSGSGPSARGAVRGELDFDVDAWDLSFRARLAGEIDCARGELHVEILDGIARRISMAGPEIGFFGRLDAMNIRQNDTLDGMWFHAPSAGGPACVGGWSAVRQN